MQIDPESRPATLAPPFTGHFRVILDTPRGLQSLHPGTKPTHPHAPGAPTNGALKPPASTPASLEIRNSIYQTTSKASRSLSAGEASDLANGPSSNGAQKMTYGCDTCGTDCTNVRYHSLKVKNFELCQPCYLDGRFPSTMFSGDFVKLTSSVNGVGHGTSDDWSDQEVLLLLEGIEMYDDDWSLIEEHVGTRSAQQCIQKFLALPIEDPYLATEGDIGPLRFGRIPFEQADNPVMSVVAFLAGVVSPGVAAEAAKTALHALTDGDKKDADGEGEKADGEEERNGQIDEDGEKMDEDKDENAVDPSSTKMGTPAPNADSSTSSGKKPATIPHSKVARAADLALRSSAKAAKALADEEDTHIRSTLASLIKLTLTKLEMKMSQFEELEEILEDERKGLESARMALVQERVSLKRFLDDARNAIVQGQAVIPSNINLGTNGQGTVMSEVGDDVSMVGDEGPMSGGEVAQLT